MEQDYRIEILSSTFADHAQMSEKHHEQIVEVFKENNPGQDLPDHMKHPFNVSQALSVICAEVEELKERLKSHIRNEHPCK